MLISPYKRRFRNSISLTHVFTSKYGNKGIYFLWLLEGKNDVIHPLAQERLVELN